MRKKQKRLLRYWVCFCLGLVLCGCGNNHQTETILDDVSKEKVLETPIDGKQEIQQEKVTQEGQTTQEDQTTQQGKTTQEEQTTKLEEEKNKEAMHEGEALPEEEVAMTSIKNPIIWADVPDMDVIRVEDTYYMVSTTMYFTPGVPIMKSKNLVNWEIVSYVYDTLEDNDICNLTNGKNAYGKGSWAACLRYHEGRYYVFFASNDQGKSYIYQTDDLEHGTWERSVIQGIYHDASILFDDDGRVYLVYGNGTIRIKELNSDVTGFQQGGVDQVLIQASSSENGLNAEGSHFYKIKDTYYITMIEWPKTGNSRRREICFRSETLLGEYEKQVLLDDNLNYGNAGVAQGGIVDTPAGEWYGLLFQDHGAVGRIPVLVPVTWENGWPMMGVDGKAPSVIDVPKGHVWDQKTKLASSDEFDYKENKLNLLWQWNHNPDHENWSVIEKPGYLRLKTGHIATNLMDARNTLTQRTEGPACTSSVLLNVSQMKPGDYAGIAAFQNDYGQIGVRVAEDGTKYIHMSMRGNDTMPSEKESFPLVADQVYLKIKYTFGTIGTTGKIFDMNRATFYYSLDGTKWIKMGNDLSMTYSLTLFTGYRTGLYYYATKQIGGIADFDYYHFSKEEW